jgi:hypothetical protein
MSEWRFAVKRLREAFAMFTSDDPIEELHIRACNKGGKTESIGKYVIECLKKAPDLDGVALPQWEGPVHACTFCIDYPQQKLSVQQTLLRLLGDWPYKPRFKGDEILSSLRVKPIGGDDDEKNWSLLVCLSEDNPNAGTGARADLSWFDEPPTMRILREMRKAPHANRKGLRIIGNTPIEIERWYELSQDYGETPRSTLRRVDEDRAECRWSLSEVANWVLSPTDKAKLRRQYERDPHRDAREHGDYIDASGSCPFDVERLREMLKVSA